MEDSIKILKILKDDFPKYARECLFIKTKNAERVNFEFNSSQKFLHKRIEEHKKKRGKVRIVVLKARQFGISTYVEGRFTHKVMMNQNMNAFIMADSRNSSANIFDMTKRYYDNIPIWLLKPELKKSNEKALVFDGIDSSVRIGTAGAKTTGRSMTNQLLHCSEVGFWANTDDIITGLFQTVPNTSNSEIILESTANGIGGFFYDKVMEGLDPKSEWETVFLPWFWHDEYRTPMPEDYYMTSEEQELKEIYNLTDSQIYWRRLKIDGDFKGREYLFAQEYPASINEAFISTQNGLIQGKYIEKAKKCNEIDEWSPVVMGVDPARNGDRTVICIRKGREIMKVIKYDDMDSMRLVGIVKNLISKYNVIKCFIDVGCGYGTIDKLKEDGYSDVVRGIPFNSGADDKRLYANKRSEIFGEMRDWFIQDGFINIPDDETISKELGIIPDMKENSNGQWFMLPKDEIKKQNNGMSTDIADAIALTFSGKVGNVIKKKIKRTVGRRFKNY